MEELEVLNSQRSTPFKELPMALSKFQGEIKNPKLSANNPHFKSKYAPLSEVLSTVRPVLAKYGLSVYQDIGGVGDKVVITTHVYHESGEFLISSPLPIPAGRGGKPMDAQGIGAAASYGKRYQLQAVLGIAADEDNDGEELANHNQPMYVPTNMVGVPSKETLAAMYQLGTGKREGFEEYYQAQIDQGRDHKFIQDALNKALKKKQSQQEQEPQPTV